jgi:hypothetical protein
MVAQEAKLFSAWCSLLQNIVPPWQTWKDDVSYALKTFGRLKPILEHFFPLAPSLPLRASGNSIFDACSSALLNLDWKFLMSIGRKLT